MWPLFIVYWLKEIYLEQNFVFSTFIGTRYYVFGVIYENDFVGLTLDLAKARKAFVCLIS